VGLVEEIRDNKGILNMIIYALATLVMVFGLFILNSINNKVDTIARDMSDITVMVAQVRGQAQFNAEKIVSNNQRIDKNDARIDKLLQIIQEMLSQNQGKGKVFNNNSGSN